ncbi:hypothetical protein NM151_0871 [Neisseria meningitidis NM151]|nr:hypothetical protein NM151_0871 [Neisseria meningitidis NM151]
MGFLNIVFLLFHPDCEEKCRIFKEFFENIEYFIVDSIQNLRAEDSFIHRNICFWW